MVATRLVTLVLIPAVATAFLGPLPKVSCNGVRMNSVVEDKTRQPVSSFSVPPGPNTSKTEGALVPVNPKNVETSAGVVTAAGGTLLFGPVIGIVLGLVTNYAAKSDNELGEAARGVGKSAIELLNFFTKVNEKYGIGSKVSETSSTLIAKLKENEGDDSVISKIEDTVNTTTSKLSELNKQYDIVDKAKSAANAAVDLSGAALDKAVELNEKYSFVDQVTEAARTAASKVKESIKKSE